MHVSSVCFKCFTCFRLILQVFYLDVAKVDLDVVYVAMTIHACFKRMFQVFHLFQTYVGSISFGCFKSRSARAFFFHLPQPGQVLSNFGPRTNLKFWTFLHEHDNTTSTTYW
jgi:hypothetical protein